MPRVMIKQMDERVSTNGLHMGGGPERRKLEPGEIVDISEDLLLPDGRPLLDVLWQTKKLEMTMDAPTRPLDFLNYKEAMQCSPTFKPRDISEENEMEKAREAVAERLAETESEAISPADDTLEAAPKVTKKKPRKKKAAVPDTATNRRAQRRAALQAAQRGAEIST